MLNNISYSVELNGYKYYIQDNEWSESEKFFNPAKKSTQYVISDFNAIAGFNQVRSPLKYADVILEKNLREEGSIAGENNIVVHFKDEPAPQSTDIFYTAVPLAEYNKHTKKIDKLKNIKLLFCFHRLLFLTLQENAKEDQVIAIIFIIGNSVDIIVGTKHEIIAFEHFSSYAPAQVIRDVNDVEIQNIQKTIEFIQRTRNVKISMLYGYTWLMGIERNAWLSDLGAQLNLPITAGDEELIVLDGERLKSSISPLFSLLTINDSISENNIKLLYNSYFLIPALAALMLVITVIAGGYYAVLRHDRNSLTLKRDHYKQSITATEEQYKSFQLLNYQEPLNLAIKLEAAKARSSFAKILSEMVNAMDSEDIMTFDAITLEYPDDMLKINSSVKIQLSGEVRKGFSNGVVFINSFVGKLRSQGYKVLDSNITPQVTMTHFNIQLEK